MGTSPPLSRSPPTSPTATPDGMLYSDRSHNDQIIIHGTMRRDQLFPGSRNERTLVMLVEENT